MITKLNYTKEHLWDVTIKEINAKTILRKRKRIDSWFVSHYGMNLYRGCRHNCVYCDGRAEGYYVDGVFGEDVSIKVNAINVLSRELDPKRKRTPFKKSFIMLGGGVGDSYQPIEKKYMLSQKTLQLLLNHDLPVHVLTKSTLVKRDVDILNRINKQRKAIVSFSFSSVDDRISSLFEPGVPSPSDRLDAIKFFKNEGIACGMFLMPVIPFLTDTSEIMEDTIRKAKEVGVDFIIFSGMTLKIGKQKDYFINAIKKNYPELIKEYKRIYPGNKWGNATQEYYHRLHKRFNKISKKYKIPKRIPPSIYKDILDENDLVIVILEHIDYLLKLEGQKSPYGYAAYKISQLNKPLSSIKDNLQGLNGVGKTTANIILEILDTKSSSYYETLLAS